MTWHSFFDMSTMEGRHLLASYAFILVLQVGYLAWTARGWLAFKKRRG
jgi:hypothetical protein